MYGFSVSFRLGWFFSRVASFSVVIISLLFPFNWLKMFLDEQQVFLAEVMVVAELQQIDAGGVGFHFFHQWGGRGDARNE